MPIRTKRIYDPPGPDDGFRLLIMRLWPRGIRKSLVSAWEKELGPSPDLLRGFRSGKVSWKEYVRRYRREMAGKPDLIRRWAERARKERITLLCSCEDESRCHRSLLAGILSRGA
jgi:uncharacterized protein YeaO (DUF488 family)